MNIDVSKARIGIVVCIFAAILFASAYKLSENGVMLGLTFVSLAGLLFFGSFNRCPHCGQGLMRVPLDTLHCPYCGGPL